SVSLADHPSFLVIYKGESRAAAQSWSLSCSSELQLETRHLIRGQKIRKSAIFFFFCRFQSQPAPYARIELTDHDKITADDSMGETAADDEGKYTIVGAVRTIFF